jgi:hypothetical protein
MSGKFHVPAVLSPWKQIPVLLDTRLGGPQSRSELYGGDKDLASAGSRILAVQPTARRCTEQ